MVNQTTLTSPSANYTRQLGAVIGARLQAGHMIGLRGELGSGKTTFCAGVGAGWGALELVTSPTFVLMHRYSRASDNTLLYHMDAYRLTDAQSAESTGLFDVLDSRAALLVEWPERIEAILPNGGLWIDFAHHDETTRTLTFRASDAEHAALLATVWGDLPKERQ